ncbi:MAG: hypothetical protein V1880_04490 [Patescibacteria group bacterium]
MNPCFFSQHRDQECSRPVFMGDGSAEVQAEAAGRETEKPPVPQLEFEFKPGITTHDEVWAKIDEKYGESPYQNLIVDYVDKLLPRGPAEYRMAIVLSSAERYGQFYKQTRTDFMKGADDLEDKFETSVNRIRGKTSEELDALKSAVEGARALTEFKGIMPPPEDKDAVEDYFDDYLDAMNGRYFNEEMDEGNEGHRNYGKLSGKFKKNMENRVEAKLDWLLNKKETKKEDLEAFKKEIADRYETYSKFDKSTSIISGADLAALEKLANPPLDAVGQVLSEGDERVIKRLEIMHLLNPGAWKDTVKAAHDMVVLTALNGGMENEFIAAARKYKEAEDFDDAVDVFEDKLEELSKVGVTETLAFLREFNTEVHSEVLDYERNIEPKSLTVQVSKQLDYLLGGVLKPHWEEDRMIVRFMTANREERQEILSNDAQRGILFRGIKMATERYPDIFAGYNVPDDVKKLRRSPDITKPTRHDQAAQLMALIILGRQAKVIVSKLNKTPQYTGRDFTAEIDSMKVPEDAKMVQEGVKFSAPGTQRARFQSALERGGFNARDLALKGVKVLGLLSILANAGQSFSETEGDFVDRIFQTGEKMLTNQGVLVGAAAAAGAHLAERNPAFLKYPWLSKYHRQKIMVDFKLENIAARLGKEGREEVNRFTFNNAEWRALSHDNMTGDKIRELLKTKAEKAKGGQKPVITVRDLSEIITEPSIISTLTRTEKSPRMRYLFYQKFFASPIKPDVNRMKELCTGTSHISPNPANPEA